MARTIYLASPEGDTGKSAVALGLVALLTRTVQRVGVFRPVARYADVRDYVLELLLAHASADIAYDEAIGVGYQEIIDDPDDALARIVQRFHEVERRCDAVVVVGSDYTDVAGATELAYNARIAANLGAPTVLVVSGRGRTPGQIRDVTEVAHNEMVANHAQVVAVVANRCAEGDLDAIKAEVADCHVPVWTVPEDSLLPAPTLRQMAASVHATLIGGDEELLSREVLGVVVGAMSVEHLLERLSSGAIVITPGDRQDVLLGLLLAHQADGFPTLAGILLTGGFTPSPVISRLVVGLSARLPILATEQGTFQAATAVSGTHGDLDRHSQPKIDTALTLFETYIDGPGLLAALDVPRLPVVTPLMFEYQLLDRARGDRKRIVLPEGDDDRILRAASTLLQRSVADLTILGDESAVRTRATELGLVLDGAQVLDPRAGELTERFARQYAELRKHKGMTIERAREVVTDISYFGTMMVKLGLADGMVSGAVHTTAHTIKPSFEIIKTVPGVGSVSSCFLMCLQDRVLVYADCAVIPDPTADQLADIAISSAATAAQFGIEPRIAMLSYSTGTSGSGVDVDKVREATRLVRERRPDLSVEGPIQYDAAVDLSVAKTKLPDSAVAGRATVFVFPDLNTGNNTYKAVQRSAGAVAIGPVLQGLRMPVNDLSRGALVQDIVNTVAITAIQAQTPPVPTSPEAVTR